MSTLRDSKLWQIRLAAIATIQIIVSWIAVGMLLAVAGPFIDRALPGFLDPIIGILGICGCFMIPFVTCLNVIGKTLDRVDAEGSVAERKLSADPGSEPQRLW